MKDCTNCRYADWARTKTGGLHPSGDGKCTFVYKLPPLPASMYWLTHPRPNGGFIHRRKEMMEHCPYFARKDSK